MRDPLCQLSWESFCSFVQFKISVYDPTYADRHTHASCNAVLLVWGLLRLAPIIERGCMAAQNSTKSKVDAHKKHWARNWLKNTQNAFSFWKFLAFADYTIHEWVYQALYCFSILQAMGIWVGPWLTVQPITLNLQNTSCHAKKKTFQCLWYMFHNLSILQNCHSKIICQFSFHNTSLKLKCK